MQHQSLADLTGNAILSVWASPGQVIVPFVLALVACAAVRAAKSATLWVRRRFGRQSWDSQRTDTLR